MRVGDGLLHIWCMVGEKIVFELMQYGSHQFKINKVSNKKMKKKNSVPSANT